MRNRTRFCFIITISFLLAACQTTTPLFFSDQQATAAVNNYVNCDECWNHQLHHVRIIGEQAELVLKDYLENPQNAIPGYLDADLTIRHGKLKAKFRALAISVDDYVAIHRQARMNRVMARAAVALNLMKDPDISIETVRIFRKVGGVVE